MEVNANGISPLSVSVTALPNSPTMDLPDFAWPDGFMLCAGVATITLVPLVERATSWLIVNKVMLPGVSVLERFVGRIRDRAQKRLWKRLVAALDDKQRERIAKLFDEDSETRFAALDSLRTVPTQRSPSEFLLHLDRLEAIRAFDLRPSPPQGVPAATLERLARVARAGKPSAIAALQEPRRTATVAALFHTLETAAQDDAAELAEALITDLVKDAEAADKKARLRSLRDLDDAALLLRDMAKLVFEENALPLDQWRDALFERLPRDDLVAAMAEVDAIARPRDAKPYAELLTRWRRARRLFFNIATRLDMDAAPGGKPVQEAIRYLATIADWSSAKMRDAPTAAIPKAWQPHVLDAEGRVADPRAYVFAIIDAWRAALKRRDIFARPGTRYGDPRRGLLDGATWQSSKLVVCRALNRSLDAETEITGLSRLLDGAYRTVAERAASNADLRFETVNGKTRIVVTPLDRLEETESLRALRPAIQGRMPKAGMPDLFLEIMQRTGFAKAFTHLSERQARVEHFETSLCAALVAEACNIGIEAVSRQDVPALRRERLTWVSQNFIRPETIAAASARIVSAHATLPLVKLWGAGDVASADGMRFTAPASAIHAGPNPKYFGQARGVTWYNLLSNQFSGLNGIVVPGTLRDSLVLLALLLEQETELEPMEIMTDTAAYSDAVFGLFWLLGYQFSPRLADLGDARLWRIDRKADYGPFNSLSKGTINLALIRENWPDVIRLVGSLKLGHLKAAGIMRTLQVRDKPTSLARALSEIGRIAKTIHILHYIDDRGVPTAHSDPAQPHGTASSPRPAHSPWRTRGNPQSASAGAGRAAWLPGPRSQRRRPLERDLHAGGHSPRQAGGHGCPQRRHRPSLAADLAPSQLPRAIRLLAARHRFGRRSQATQEPYFRMGLLNSLMLLFCSAQPHRPNRRNPTAVSSSARYAAAVSTSMRSSSPPSRAPCLPFSRSSSCTAPMSQDYGAIIHICP